MHPQLNGLHIAILVTDGYEQQLLSESKKALEMEGAITKIVSNSVTSVQGVDHGNAAEPIKVEVRFDEADPKDFDALVLLGGDDVNQNRDLRAAQPFVQGMDEAGKPIAVIGQGAWLLVAYRLLEGKTLTSSPAQQDAIRNAGGIWVDQEVVVDGNWISSRTSDDIAAFNEKMIEAIAARMQAALRGTPDAHAVGIASS